MSGQPEAWEVPTAGSMRELAFRRVDRIILGEIERARPALRALREEHPRATRRELVDLLIDRKRSYAGTGGIISGSLGLAGVPVDMVMMTYLQISLAVEIALLHGANLKSRTGQREVLDVVARGNGAGPLHRGGIPMLAFFGLHLLRRRGWPSLGRVFPVLAMPVCAWLNSRDLRRMGDTAQSHYDGLARLADRRRRVSGKWPGR